MKEKSENVYRGWSITVEAENKMCSNFSFSITDPSGKSQKVTMGGDNKRRALERAREMIDLEVDFATEA